MPQPEFSSPSLDRRFVPPELAHQPFNARRAHYYPSRPLIPQSVAAQGPGPIPTYMPQKLGFRRWKTPPYDVDWVSAVSSPVRAGAAYQTLVQRTSHTGLPIADVARAAAALRANRLPEPTDNLDLRTAIAQGVNPRSRSMPPVDLDAIGRAQAQLKDDAQVSRILAREQARAQARGTALGLGALRQVDEQPQPPQVIAGQRPEKNYWGWLSVVGLAGITAWLLYSIATGPVPVRR